MGQRWEDLRYAVLVLGKNPRFTAVAILSLALGIGANVAVFSLMNAFLLRDLPVRQADRLVEVSLIRRDSKVPFLIACSGSSRRASAFFAD
jgi:hypothetical protein